MANNKVTGIRDWLVYVEDDKTKAIDITGGENTSELVQLCHEYSLPVIGFVSFEKEPDAIKYCDMFRN